MPEPIPPVRRPTSEASDAPLLVLYDSACPFCVRCREWLEAAEQLVELRFLCCRSALARERFGGIEGLATELVVVASDGSYWVGPEAFVVCLWALASGRGASGWLSSSLLWWVARPVFREVTAQRGLLGSFVGAPCHGGHCDAPSATAPRSAYR